MAIYSTFNISSSGLLFRSPHCPTQFAIEKLCHDPLPEPLPFQFHVSPNLLQSIITTFVVVWCQISSSGCVEALTKMQVKVPTLKHKYQVVCNNAAPDESDCPFVVLG